MNDFLGALVLGSPVIIGVLIIIFARIICGPDKSPPHPKGGTMRYPWYDDNTGKMTYWHPDATR